MMQCKKIKELQFDSERYQYLLKLKERYTRQLSHVSVRL